MPFIRQSRDKRGFEYTYVMHTYHPGGGNHQRPRLLYLFRSPASVKLGRTALDAEVMEALEHTHPDLSFDWQALSRDAVTTRPENGGERERPQQQPQQRRPAPDRNERNRVEVPPDDSVLGRAVGAGEAARMRRRYAELLQRIARRARTPEERDRLTERLKRLNPDDWTDEAAVRANAPGADAGWNAIGGELPSRRRGRRGGRGRNDGQPAPSGIMDSDQNTAEAGDEGPDETHISGAGDADGGDDAVSSVTADSDQEAPADPDLPLRD